MSQLRESLTAVIQRFSGVTLLVAGDLILDEFIWGRVERISPEAPVPVVEVHRETSRLGGAANVAANIAALGARVLLVGVAGRDRAGRILLKRLEEEGISSEGIVHDPQRITSVKTRIIAHHQQVCRTDRESRSPLSEATRARVQKAFQQRLGEAGGAVLSDYSKGVVGEDAASRLIGSAKEAGVFVAVDPKAAGFARYFRASIITPNLKEAERASGISIGDRASLAQAAGRLLDDSQAESLLITQGESGMTLFEGRNEHAIPTMAREVFDVTGAGDTVVAVLTLAVAAGAPIYEAALLSNLAAGIVVGKLGTATLSPEELLTEVRGGDWLQ